MIELFQVSYAAQGELTLDSVSLAARAGELLAVVGPNGAGKSTLLRVMAGEYGPTSGDVRMGGRALSTWSIRDRARVRAVSRHVTDIDLRCSAGRTVALGRSPHHGGVETARDAAIVRLAMEATDTTAFEKRPFAMLSSGERQRLRLARAFAQIWEGPAGRLLLLDDPVAGLDPSHQHRCLGHARRMAADGCAVVCALHDLNLACRYADVVAVLSGGRLRAYGVPTAVLTPTLLANVFDMDASLPAFRPAMSGNEPARAPASLST